MNSYSYKITGGKPLKGDVNISGSKNAVLGILAASMMIDGTCTLENVPDISDVHVMVDICESIGAKIETEVAPEGSLTLHIDPREISTYEATEPDVSKIRASYYLLGAEFGRRIESVDIHDSGRVDNVNETVFFVICTADISYHSDTLCNDGAKSDKSEYTADYSQNSVLSSLSLDDLH